MRFPALPARPLLQLKLAFVIERIDDQPQLFLDFIGRPV
jgi:hypothetical protein